MRKKKTDEIVEKAVRKFAPVSREVLLERIKKRRRKRNLQHETEQEKSDESFLRKLWW